MEEPIYTVTLHLTREGAEKYLEDGYTVVVSTRNGAVKVFKSEEDEFEVVPVGINDVSLPALYSWNALDLAETLATEGCD